MSHPTEKVINEDELEDFKNPEEKGKTFRMANQKIMLTYKTHLDKVAFKEWFVDFKCKKNPDTKKPKPPSTIEMAHESGDKSHNYLHTHVVVDYGYVMTTKSCRFYDYTPEGSDESIHPNIRLITKPSHYRRALKYLSKEDPDCFHLKGESESAADKLQAILESKNVTELFTEITTGKDAKQLNLMELNQSIQLMRTVGFASSQKKSSLHPSLLIHPWQQRLLQDISYPADLRKIIWYVDTKGGSGKSEFTASMVDHEPENIIRCDSGRQADIAYGIRKDMERIHKPWLGTDGNCIILDLPRQAEEYDSIYAFIEKCKNGRITSTKYDTKQLSWDCVHIIVFTNWHPDKSQLSEDRWDIRFIDRDDPKDCLPVEIIKFRRANHLNKRGRIDYASKYNNNNEIETPPEED